MNIVSQALDIVGLYLVFSIDGALSSQIEHWQCRLDFYTSDLMPYEITLY